MATATSGATWCRARSLWIWAATGKAAEPNPCCRLRRWIRARHGSQVFAHQHTRRCRRKPYRARRLRHHAERPALRSNRATASCRHEPLHGGDIPHAERGGKLRLTRENGPPFPRSHPHAHLFVFRAGDLLNGRGWLRGAKAPARLFHPTDRTTARDATIATPRQAPDDSKEGMELVQYGGSERNDIVRFDDVAMIVSARQAAHHHDPGQAAKRQGPAKDVYMTATGGPSREKILAVGERSIHVKPDFRLSSSRARGRRSPWLGGR